MTSPSPKPLCLRAHARASTFCKQDRSEKDCKKKNSTLVESSPYRICSPVSASSRATRSSHLVGGQTFQSWSWSWTVVRFFWSWSWTVVKLGPTRVVIIPKRQELSANSHLVALSSTSGVSWTEGMSTSGKSLETIPCFDVIVLLVLVFSCCEEDGTSSPFWVAACRRTRHRRIILRIFELWKSRKRRGILFTGWTWVVHSWSVTTCS